MHHITTGSWAGLALKLHLKHCFKALQVWLLCSCKSGSWLMFSTCTKDNWDVHIPTNQHHSREKKSSWNLQFYCFCAEPVIDTVEGHCHSQCNSTTCCQENDMVISYNPLQESDQLPNTCLDQTDIRQNDPWPSRTECKSCTVTGVLLAGDQAAHHFLGNCYSVEVTSVTQQNPKAQSSIIMILLLLQRIR